MIRFAKLWKLLDERNISQYDLVTKYHVSASRLYQLRHNNNVRTVTIDKICKVLNCKPEDILEWEMDDELSKAIQHIRSEKY